MGLWPSPKRRRAEAAERRQASAKKLEGESPFAEAGSLVRENLNQVAASLLDDETYGYVVVRLVKDDEGEGSMEVKGHVRPEWRAPFLATLNRIIRHGLPTDP